MASRTMSLGTHEIDNLKETLHAQQELLQKLYNELDVERESSATAADETLSMILRLQGEKAAMEMEASQYKRIAEEKMCHAQEMVEIFQELIYQKEMQIASLAFQVQAYRFKLASLGCDDLAPPELQFPENMLSRRNNSSVGEASGQMGIRRGNSVPPFPNGSMSRRTSTEGARTESSSPKTLQENGVEPPLRRENTSLGDINSYWDEIKKLDERVKEFTCLNDSSSSSLLNPPKRELSLRYPSPDNSPEKKVFHEYPGKVLNVQACGGSPHSPTVQDIFEVPQCPEDDLGGTSCEKERAGLSIESETMNGKVDSDHSVWNDIWQSNLKDGIDWEKQPLLSLDGDRNSLKPKDVEERSDSEKKPLSTVSCHSGSPKQKDGKFEKLKLYKHPTVGVADFELQQFNRRIKQLEDDRFVTRGREINFETGDEELKLLREIMERVEAVQSEITSWRMKKLPAPEDRSFGCFKEVMFCFLPK